MKRSNSLPSAIAIVAPNRETLVRILDGLGDPFNDPDPGLLRESSDGAWRRLIMIPGFLCIHSFGRIGPEVRQAACAAYGLGASEVSVVTHELTFRRLGRLARVVEPPVNS